MEGLNLDQDDFPFAIIEEVQKELKSHRGLFYKHLMKNQGTIVHIGNPDFINDYTGWYFGGKLFMWYFISEKEPIPKKFKKKDLSNQQFYFQFEQEYIVGLKQILKLALIKSPIRKAYFLTDYQFGPKKKQFCKLTHRILWTLHDSEGLRFNTLYIFDK